METPRTTSQLVHDARSALGVIQTTAELGLMESDVSGQSAESFTRIIEQVGILSSLLSELSTASSK
jgi:hypothetical protein